MLVELPINLYRRGKNCIYYQAKDLCEGQCVHIKIITPSKKEFEKELEDVGYGLYILDFEFIDIGDYRGILFENGKHIGSSIFRIAL